MLIWILLFVVVIMLIGILSYSIYHFLQIDAKQKQGIGWKEDNSWFTIAEQETDDKRVFAEICKNIEEMLDRDTKLHIDTILFEPKEYDIWEQLETLIDVEERNLTNEEWLLYARLNWCSQQYKEGSLLPDYSCALSDISGVLNKLPELFYTSYFDEIEDIELYFENIKQVPFVLRKMVEKIQQQQEIGMEYMEEVMQDAIQLCQQQKQDEGVFFKTFEEKINACEFLTSEEKKRWITENAELVEKYVWEAYKETEIALAEIKTSKNYKGLCEYPKGKEYYNYLLKITTGSDKSAEEIYELLENTRQVIQENLEEVSCFPSSNKEASAGTVESIIEMLYKNTQKDFPGEKEINYQLKNIPENLQKNLYQAFYMKDKKKNTNYIYIYKDAVKQPYLSLYQTLAHEAFPGHMYDYNFDDMTPYPNIESQIKCLGYSEGWAVYAEFAAEDWLEEEMREEYHNQVEQKLFDEIVLCQIDIGIHTMGWGIDEIEEFSKEVYGYGTVESATQVMKTLVNNAGAYQSYVVGYLELKELEKYYCEERGISWKAFIEAYQKCGQAPFSIVRQYMERIFTAQAS